MAEQAWQVLSEFTLRNGTGGEDLSESGTAAVIEVVSVLRLPATCLAGLKTAVRRAAQNALIHRDRLQPELPISVRVYTFQKVDSHQQEELPDAPRGWGYFFIEKLSDDGSSDPHPVVELFLYPEGSM